MNYNMDYNTGMNNIEKYNAAQYNEVIMDLDDDGYKNPIFKLMYNTKDNKVRLEDIKNCNYRDRNIGAESYNKRYYDDVFKRKSRSLPNKEKSQKYKNMLDDISNDYKIGNNNVNNNNIINDNQEYIENVSNEHQAGYQTEYQDDVSDNTSNDADEEDERDDNQEHIEAIEIGNDHDNYLLL